MMMKERKKIKKKEPTNEIFKTNSLQLFLCNELVIIVL